MGHPHSNAPPPQSIFSPLARGISWAWGILGAPRLHSPPSGMRPSGAPWPPPPPPRHGISWGLFHPLSPLPGRLTPQDTGHCRTPSIHTVPCGAWNPCRPLPRSQSLPRTCRSSIHLAPLSMGPQSMPPPPKSTLHSAKSHAPHNLCPQHPQIPLAAAHPRQRKAPERDPGFLPTSDSGCTGTGAQMLGFPCSGREGGSCGVG